MNLSNHILAAGVGLFLIALGFVAGCRYAGRGERPSDVQTDTVYVNRTLERRDTVTVDKPVERRIYLQQFDTVFIRVPVPVDFQPAGIISPAPIRIDGRNVTLTYWAPDSLRFIQDRYVVSRPRWGIGPDLSSTVLLGRNGAVLTHAAGIRIKYRGLLSGTLGYGVLTGPGWADNGWTVTARLNPMWPR